MSTRSRLRLPANLLAVAVLASVASVTAAPVQAAVGVEKISRHAGAPGDEIELTLGCGFCYPPCHGAPGHRTPSPCMLGTHAEPPESFSISLVPIGKAPLPHRCGPNALCSPHPSGAPRRAPYTYLGLATGPSDDGSQPDGRYVPRYALQFEVPDLQPGTYAFVIFCDVCMRGKAGSLIAAPETRLWQFRVRPPDPRATIGS